MIKALKLHLRSLLSMKSYSLLRAVRKLFTVLSYSIFVSVAFVLATSRGVKAEPTPAPQEVFFESRESQECQDNQDSQPLEEDTSIHRKKLQEELVRHHHQGHRLLEKHSVLEAPVASGAYEMTVMSTAYCLRGTTASGYPAGPGVIAVDPSVIPLGTRVFVPGYGEAYARDTGGVILGRKIDIWLPTSEDCYRWGLKEVTITIYKE